MNAAQLEEVRRRCTCGYPQDCICGAYQEVRDGRFPLEVVKLDWKRIADDLAISVNSLLSATRNSSLPDGVRDFAQSSLSKWRSP